MITWFTKRSNDIVTLLFIISFSISLWVNTRSLVFTSINTFVVFYLVGKLIFNIVNIKFEDISTKLILTISFSVFINIILGLIINSLFYLGVVQPLSKDSIKLFYPLAIISFYVLSLLVRNRSKSPKIKLNSKFLTTIFIGIALICLSLLGTRLLNAGFESTLTQIMLGLMGLIVLFLVVIKDKATNFTYAFILYSIAVSLLFMYSMRSNYLVGWDIHQEFRVFQITKLANRWNFNNYPDAYNATLSITLLPSVFSEILQIKDVYIYKLYYPLVLGIVPVFIYYTARKLLKNKYAFLTAFFFVSQFQFMQQMPALNRQLMAFVFFASLIYTLTTSTLNKYQRHFLFLCFGFGLIVSHYSTSYITVILLTIAYSTAHSISIFNWILSRIIKIKAPKISSNLSFLMLSGFIAMTFFWYVVVTDTATDLQNKAITIVQNLGANTNATKTEQAKYAIWGVSSQLTQENIQLYRDQIEDYYQNGISWIQVYPDKVTNQYDVYIRSARQIPTVSGELSQISFYVMEFVKKTIKLFMILGVILLLVRMVIVLNTPSENDLTGLTIGALFLLLAITYLPFLSQYYNFERLYQQMLVVLSMVIVLFVVLLPKFPKALKDMLLVGMFLIYFYNNNGLLNQTIGGKAYLNLNNFGEDYDRFYTQEADLASAKWLELNIPENKTISLDNYAALEFTSHTKLTDGFLFDLVPGSIPDYGYVYASSSNTITGVTRSSYQNRTLLYNYPFEFLGDNKGKIYSNGKSSIYY